MRINLITNHNSRGLIHDVNILRGLLTIVYKDVELRKVPHIFPECSEAEMNIFIETINPALFPYASKNIWIPNIEWTYKTWEPYFHMIDEVWAKTKESFRIFNEITPKTRFIGWTSIDQTFSPKNWDKAFVPVGKNSFRHPKPILQAYLKIKQSNRELYKQLPDLYVQYDSKHISVYCPTELDDKVKLISESLTDAEYSELLKDAGLVICTSSCEGFCHAVNEAMSSGCNLILSPIQPFLEMTEQSAHFVTKKEYIDHPSCYGTLIDISVDSIVEKLVRYIASNQANISEKMRTLYEKHHSQFLESMKSLLVMNQHTPYSLANIMIEESKLPDVSIVTLTYNRPMFMPLAKYSYLIQSYPEHKLEWIIVDDGESIEDTLIGIPNVKYVRSETKLTIGEKRNLGVENAMYNTIVMMDDDDVYPNNSILHRVAMMYNKECTFCTTIPCYDIQKHISFMNIPPMTLPMSQRVSEATLCFSKKFWSERKFTNIQVAEGDAFIHGREQMCRELSPQNIIVSLVHSGNTSSRKINVKEPNGCHYGFTDELFMLVSKIGEELNTSCQKSTDGGETCGETCRDGGDGVHPSQVPQEERQHQHHHHHASLDPGVQASCEPSSS
jgi:hypothetical protein